MEKITRTLEVTEISYLEAVVKDGTPALEPREPEKVFGNVEDKAKAAQLLNKKYGSDKTFLVTGLEVSQGKYEISIEDFLAHAKKVEPKKAESPTEDESEDSTLTSESNAWDDDIPSSLQW